MKKIFFCVSFLIFSLFSIFAQSRNDYIHKATSAGLSFKKAVVYAELKEKSSTEGTILTAKESKKLEKLELKIEQGEQKQAKFAEANPTKSAEKQEKINKKTDEKITRKDAVDAYENYIYYNEKNDDIPLNPKTGFPEIINKPFFIFDEGISFDMITRLQKQDKYDRSDFVWQNYLIGAYFDATTVNMKPVNSMIRVAAYYPFYYTFNGMEQFPKQTILYAFDLYAGPVFHANMWQYVLLNFSAGLHYMYQLTDEYHLNYLGAGIVLGAELPVARRWTVVNNGTFTLDYANFGTNQKVQPFDYAWSYQISLGVRYSKKKLHKYAYIHKIEKKDKNISNSTINSESSSE